MTSSTLSETPSQFSSSAPPTVQPPEAIEQVSHSSIPREGFFSEKSKQLPKVVFPFWIVKLRSCTQKSDPPPSMQAIEHACLIVSKLTLFPPKSVILSQKFPQPTENPYTKKTKSTTARAIATIVAIVTSPSFSI